MGQNILFVTYMDEEGGDGFDYAIDLARMTGKGIFVLILDRARSMVSRFENLMTAVTSAEAGEHETARYYSSTAPISRPATGNQDAVAKGIKDKCAASGVQATVQTASPELGTALDDVLRKDRSIDMVLLSPTITDKGGVTDRALARLVKKVSRPVVTITRHAGTRHADGPKAI